MQELADIVINSLKTLTFKCLCKRVFKSCGDIWNNPTESVVTAPSMKTFKTKLTNIGTATY